MGLVENGGRTRVMKGLRGSKQLSNLFFKFIQHCNKVLFFFSFSIVCQHVWNFILSKWNCIRILCIVLYVLCSAIKMTYSELNKNTQNYIK